MCNEYWLLPPQSIQRTPGHLRSHAEAILGSIDTRDFFLHSPCSILHCFFMDDPIIDLHSDHYFMGEALRQAAKAYEREEVPVGAVVVREGRIIARGFHPVELLKDATAHGEMAP